MTRLGADADALDDLSRALKASADALRMSTFVVGTHVRSVFWLGADAERFRAQWARNDRPSLERTADRLVEAAESLTRQASEQRTISGDTPSASERFSAAGPHAESVETYEVSTDLGALVVGQDNTSSVEIVRMSDGTYRVSIDSELWTSLGVSTEDLLDGVPIGKIINEAGKLELDVSAGDGFTLELSAADAESAREAADLLAARVASISNRFTGGGVDTQEIDLAQFPDGVSVESFTKTHFGVGTGGGIDVLDVVGADVACSTNNETVSTADGTRIDRTVVNAEMGGSGWNKDFVHESYSVEIVRDAATGEVTGVRAETSTTAAADVRGGGEKFRDLMLPGVDNTEFEITQTVNTYEADIGAIASNGELAAAIEADDRATVRRILTDAGEYRDQTLTYKGSSDSSSRGVSVFNVGYESTTAYGDLRLTSAHNH